MYSKQVLPDVSERDAEDKLEYRGTRTVQALWVGKLTFCKHKQAQTKQPRTSPKIESKAGKLKLKQTGTCLTLVKQLPSGTQLVYIAND